MGVNGIYGLSGSGLDIESLVKVGMLGKQKQYDKLYKRELKAEMEKEVFAGIYKDLFAFKYKTLSDYKMQSNMSAMKASSSNESFITARANGSAVAMAHRVEVTELSANAHLLTKDKIHRDGTAANSIQLKDNVFQDLQRNADGTFTYKDKDGNTHTAAADAKAISFTLNGTNQALTTEEQKKNTVTYTFADLYNGKTYNDLAADINAKSTGITASYDATTDSFSLYNKTSGSEAGINLTMAGAADGGEYASQLFNNLHLEQSKDGALHQLTPPSGHTVPFAAGQTNGCMGADGKVKVDGKEYTGVKNNSLTVGGVTYNFLGKTTGVTTVSVSQDTDKIIENVKKFVEDYNKLIDDLSEKYNTSSWNYDTSSDYEPLTESEKSGMTQTQIEEWNKKVKSGLLYHNKIIGNLLTAMREAISTPVKSVDGQYNSASSIGITSSNNKGHLTLDEDKLKKALAAEPDCVYKIFANDQDKYYSTDANKKRDYIRTDDYNNRGIINRLYYNAVNDGIAKVKDYAGVSSDSKDETTLGKKITRFKTNMDNFKSKMDDYKTRLFKKYDAMETMIARLNSMYNTIFGGGTK